MSAPDSTRLPWGIFSTDGAPVLACIVLDASGEHVALFDTPALALRAVHAVNAIGPTEAELRETKGAEVERCSCEEALALRAELAKVRAELSEIGEYRTSWQARAMKLDFQLSELKKSTKTPHDQAVLDAGNLVLDSSLRRIADENGGQLAEWAKAELARRDAAK